MALAPSPPASSRLPSSVPADHRAHPRQASAPRSRCYVVAPATAKWLFTLPRRAPSGHNFTDESCAWPPSRFQYEKYVMSRFERKPRSLDTPSLLFREQNYIKMHQYVTVRRGCARLPSCRAPACSARSGHKPVPSAPSAAPKARRRPTAAYRTQPHGRAAPIPTRRDH
jgi:hypothetical protein